MILTSFRQTVFFYFFLRGVNNAGTILLPFPSRTKKKKGRTDFSQSKSYGEEIVNRYIAIPKKKTPKTPRKRERTQESEEAGTPELILANGGGGGGVAVLLAARGGADGDQEVRLRCRRRLRRHRRRRRRRPAVRGRVDESLHPPGDRRRRRRAHRLHEKEGI